MLLIRILIFLYSCRQDGFSHHESYVVYPVCQNIEEQNSCLMNGYCENEVRCKGRKTVTGRFHLKCRLKLIQYFFRYHLRLDLAINLKTKIVRKIHIFTKTNLSHKKFNIFRLTKDSVHNYILSVTNFLIFRASFLPFSVQV